MEVPKTGQNGDKNRPMDAWCVQLNTVTATQTPILKICLQQNLGRGSALDLGLKVSGYHGEFGKKIKKIAPGVQHCVPTANVNNADPGTCMGNMGKVPKIAIFGNFPPGNQKTEKN